MTKEADVCTCAVTLDDSDNSMTIDPTGCTYSGHFEPAIEEPCSECKGFREYWTEWNDAAELDPKLKALVLEYPNPPDGTVFIRCPKCNSPKPVEETDDNR